MIFLLLFLIIVAWIIGGQFKGWFRDIFVPILLGLGVLSLGHPWLGLACCATYQMIRLGYGNYSPSDDLKPSFLARLTHDRGGWWIRAIYGLLVAVTGAMPLYLGHILSLPRYISYIAINTALGFLCSRLRLSVYIFDAIIATGIGAILFLIR